ncbi:hypothetical protein QBC41DRAFT_390211 [Cercophora samala]|uniref:Tetratricopeptide repeat protein n=1 Tax=Cercophora samala TaxID=330535 RepID=A0AA40DBB7_9PEZI|nr:hypothetical protein QBC41DRAFT_390211 [Cercophora samala]
MGCGGSKPANAFKVEEANARKLIMNKQYSQAEKIYRDILQARRQKFGQAVDHPDMLETMASLADVLERQKKTKEAAEIRAALRDRLVRQIPAKRNTAPRKAATPKAKKPAAKRR